MSLSKFILAGMLAAGALLPANAFAGDGVTVIFTSGRMIYINNGFTQLTESLKEFNRKGADNYVAEINIEGSTFYINLDDVAVICRDNCSSMKITDPKKE